MSDEEIAALYWHWPFWARPDQLSPEGEWTSWLMLGGRGAGKTRAGAEWIRRRVEQPNGTGAARRIALIGETYSEARAVMVEGPSGLLSISPPDWRPKFLPSRHLLVWPNGAEARLFSSERPETLRGPQFDTAWCDELAKWRYDETTWDMLQFGLRLGQQPRQMITTTPRPTARTAIGMFHGYAAAAWAAIISMKPKCLWENPTSCIASRFLPMDARFPIAMSPSQ